MKIPSYRRFSCPDTPGDDWIAAIAVAQGAAAVEMLMERKHEAVSLRTKG